MKWDPKFEHALAIAFNEDLRQFAKMLRENPDYLLYEDGNDTWLWMAAGRGWLPHAKLLVELGIDVNHPRDHNPEGAIDGAAGAGHVEVVRWLLDHGAKINFEVKGQIRCLPLTAAAMGGHLEVVKLLVQHGAAVNSVWSGQNALSFARMYGHDEVADYLVSQGAKMPDELVERDIPTGHSAILQHVAREKGELNPTGQVVLPDTMPGEPPIAIYATQPCDDSPMQTAFTLGMSDRDIPLGDGLTLRGELAIFLPPDWPLTPEALAEERHNWPLARMLRIAREVQDTQSWPAPQDPLIMNGNPPQPLAAGTQLCGFLCRLEQTSFADLILPDNRVVKIITVFPIYAKEAEFVRQHGSDELVERFQDREVPISLNPKRKSIV